MSDAKRLGCSTVLVHLDHSKAGLRYPLVVLFHMVASMAHALVVAWALVLEVADYRNFRCLMEQLDSNESSVLVMEAAEVPKVFSQKVHTLREQMLSTMAGLTVLVHRLERHGGVIVWRVSNHSERGKMSLLDIQSNLQAHCVSNGIANEPGDGLNQASLLG